MRIPKHFLCGSLEQILKLVYKKPHLYKKTGHSQGHFSPEHSFDISSFGSPKIKKHLIVPENEKF